MLIYICWY